MCCDSTVTTCLGNLYSCAWKVSSNNAHNNIIFSSKYWRQPKCPSTVEWTNALWYSPTVEYNRALQIT